MREASSGRAFWKRYTALRSALCWRAGACARRRRRPILPQRKPSARHLAQGFCGSSEEGLVIRKEYMEVPIRVEYSTTTLCDRLMPILESLSDWGEALMQARGLTAHLSLTHEGGTAAAFVVLERREASASLKEEPECSTLR